MYLLVLVAATLIELNSILVATLAKDCESISLDLEEHCYTSLPHLNGTLAH